MSTYIYLCLMFTTLIYLNTINGIPLSSLDLASDNNRLSDIISLERAGLGSNHYWINPQYSDDYMMDDEIVHGKRDIEKKWAKFHHGGRSAYTIAFPALIRTR
ncbi:hypothetical protein I4U23_011962 [Adineta vaga]|nr:hypothetical protein I4U23_011962 [Adineta vaga]